MKLKLYLTSILATFALTISGFSFGQSPVANFSGSPLSGCSPMVVNFQDLSTGNPTSWNWDFGNGNTSSLRNPSASYFAPGTYTVSLTVTNSNGSNTMTRSQYITVYDNPNVSFTGTPTTGCFPRYVQFTDASTPGMGNVNVGWEWDFGNGTTSTQQNPQAYYTSSGNFTVTLKVTNDKGCSKSFSRVNYIQINGGVTASFNQSAPTVCGAPATINFTNTSTGIPTLTYFWNFGDGNTSTATNPSHTYTGNGTFNVFLVATSSAGCQDTAFSTVTVGGYNTQFTAPTDVCVGDTVNFTNTSNPAPISSSWTFGDGGSANTLNASHTYSAPGSYTVWLYNTYSACNDSTSRVVNVVASPVTNFSAPVTSRCQPPLTVNFQDNTPGAVTWFWDFGDGGTSTLQNPSHTYTSYGSFDVQLITTNSTGCSDTLIRTAYVIIRRAIISIDSLPTEGCIPYSFTFNPNINAVDVVTSYQWDFGDGGTSTASNPTHTYTVLGTYTVRLIITTSTGCTDTLTVNNAVEVGTPPAVNFSAAPLNVCAREPIQFTDLSNPGDRWRWEFGDGSISTLQNPIHFYTDTGFFSVKLIVWNNGCKDSITRVNYVYVRPPVARYNYTANCSNRLEFTFIDQSIAPLTWFWRFGDGTTSTSQNPVHTFPSLGTYNVTLIVTNGSCTDSVTFPVQAIDENPDFSANTTVVCKPGVVTFTASNVNPSAIASYLWRFGDGSQQSSTTGSISHTYTVAGNYSVTLVTTDMNGCLDSVVRTNYIRVNGPLANFSAVNPNGCAGMTVLFNDLSTTDGINNIVGWQWNFGDGTIQNFTGPPFQHTYNSVDTFTVRLIVTDAAGCVDSITLNNLVITTDPIPNFFTRDTLTCPGSSFQFFNTSTPQGSPSFWDFGDGNTSVALNPFHSYANTGVYSVKLRITDANGCMDSLTRNLYVTVDRPIADFSMSDTAGSCIPVEVHFTNNSTYYASSYWDFGGQGTSILTNPIHYFSQPGTYAVKLVVTSPGGCQDSITRNVVVYDTAGSRLTYNPIGGCKPLTVSLNSFSPGPMDSLIWDFGDGTTVTTVGSANSITHTYQTIGDFLPKLILLDPTGCLIPLQGLDTVNVIGGDANFGIDTNLFCDFGTVNFIDSTVFNDPISTYTWFFGDGNTSNQQTPTHTYTSPGIYTVSLAIETLNGCRDTATKQNIIRVVQSPQTDIGGDTTTCIGYTLLHSGVFLQPDTSVVTWFWSFPNGSTSTQQNPVAQLYTVAGTFVVTSIATNATGCTDTTRQTIIVNPLPVVNMPPQMTIQNGFPVQIPATYSPNPINWVWSPAQGLSCTDCPNPYASPRFNTNYMVYFTDSNGCSNTGSIMVNVICKNANVFMPNTFSPNGDGSNDIFYPRGRGLDRIHLLRVFNRWGEVVFEKKDFPVNDALSGWDGKFKGKKPQADVYVYQVEVFCENGDLIRLNGNIALIL